MKSKLPPLIKYSQDNWAVEELTYPKMNREEERPQKA